MNKVEKYLSDSDKLFKEWKNKELSGTINHRGSVFIRDGVVCPEIWFSSEIRPLFLLKEAYGGQADWDLCKDHILSERKTGKMWNRVAQWTKGIMTTTVDEIPAYSKYKCSTLNKNDDLKKIAVVNVKKSDGNKNSDLKTLDKYAEYDKKQLMQQLEICDPTIIICGYTGTPLDIITSETKQNIRKNWNENLYYHMTLNGHDVIVIDYWHPANQYPDLLNYYGLMNIYQLALKNK